MIAALRSRALLLVVCAAIGVGLALVGTSVGATGPITTTSSNPEFVVSEDTITYEQAGKESTVVENVSDLERIEFEEVGEGTFEISTERSQPLTDAERAIAIEVVRTNDSVQQAMAELREYELTVAPIRSLTVRDHFTTNVTPVDDGDPSAENTTSDAFVVESTTDGTVTVDRQPEFVEDEAVVRIADANGNTEYSVVVDLETRTIIDGIDWETD